MIIEVNGVEYIGWTSATVTIRLDSLSNAFQFQATSEDGKPLPFKGGEACSVLVSGEKVLTGFIEVVSVDGDNESHTISISGRDKTGDVLDSKIGSLSDIRPPITLKSVIELVLKHINSPVKVVSEINTSAFEKVEDLIAPEPGQDVWDFIQSLARKKQVLLSSNPNGDIIITRSSGENVDASIINRIKDNTNNVISYSASYDTTGLYNVYKITAQMNPIAIIEAGSSDNDKIVNQTNFISDDTIRFGRQFALVAENAGSDPIERAKWERNIRRARGRVYSATVDGFRNQTGNLWGINQLISINDDFADIQTKMLVNSVQFDLSEDGGRKTTLSFVEKNAYTLELEEPEKMKKDKLGLDFLSLEPSE